MPQKSLIRSIIKSAKGFLYMTPMLLGVILAMGLFQTYVTRDMLRNLFSGTPFYDMLIGVAAGGVSAGQPVASYIIGGELLEGGVGVYAVAAFIVSWVTVGILQLPLEQSLFGTRFTLQRNLLNVIFAMLVTTATGLSMEWIS